MVLADELLHASWKAMLSNLHLLVSQSYSTSAHLEGVEMGEVSQPSPAQVLEFGGGKLGKIAFVKIFLKYDLGYPSTSAVS